MSYDAEAKRIANVVRRRGDQPHQGVVSLSAGAAAIFGNGDYARESETRQEVRLLVLDAFEREHRVLGFAVDDVDGSAWTLIVECADLDWLKARLHDAFFDSHPIYNGSEPGDPHEAILARGLHHCRLVD